MRYAELQVTSHFSFLRGASGCDELFATAQALGIEALGIVDRNSLAGIVRAWEAAKETGVRLVVGCRLDLTDGMSMLVYPTDRAAYSRLCRLLSLGKERGGKGKCILDLSDVALYAEGLLAILIPDEADDACAVQLRKVKEIFGDRAYMALTLRRRPNDQLRLHELNTLAIRHKVRPVVTNDVLFHEPGRRQLQDVVTCIRHRTTIDQAGFLRERHADRFLKPPEEMHRLFGRYPEALARTREIVDRCRFDMSELTYQYPEEAIIPGLTAQQTLEKFTWEGVRDRYPEGVPDDVVKTLNHELDLIRKLDYAPYFLTVYSIVRFARSQDILCQGRGSAANSAVCYVLGITAIDPAANDLLFERFISAERNEPPDIDVDFEHARREEVIQWIYKTYGRQKAALCATVTRYRAKGALRDVGKVLGLPEDMITALSAGVWGWSKEGVGEKQVNELNMNMSDRRLRLTLELAQQLMGAPRHLGQHPGGFVLTNDRLDELVPIEQARMEDRQTIEWDKDDIEALKFMKVDVLALGMLTCMAKGFALLEEHKGVTLDLARIEQEDPATYAMIRKADTIGTFQIESRAQMSMLPRLKPQTYYDLVIQVAIVRPGPIQGDMVHPYLRRREGKEAVVYPKPELEAVLGKTLGVPLFQESAMKVAIVCAGFTAGEADALRRSMATFKFTGGVSKFKDKLVQGMVKNGYTEEFAEKTFSQLEGFGSYGFPESHAASFALIAYASSYIKCHYPDVFCAALINAQPMGFYAPAQIVTDARAHGVAIRPVCINRSRWDCTLEEISGTDGHAVRLGMRLVKGLPEQDAAKIAVARDEPFVSIDDMWRRAGVSSASLVKLAEADAFRPGLKLERRDALWAIKALRDEPLPLFAAAADRERAVIAEQQEPDVTLRQMTEGANVVEDYGHTGVTLRAHPVSFLREDLARRNIVTCAEATTARDRRWLMAAGLVLVRQKPGSAKGVMFMTIEDETGVANVVVWPSLFEKQRRVVLGSAMMAINGKIQREGGVVHLVAQRLFDLTSDLASLGERGGFRLPSGRGDEFVHGAPGSPDSRERPPMGVKAREIYVPDLHIDTLKVKSRNFQ